MAIIYPSIATGDFASTKTDNEFSGSQTITGSLISSGSLVSLEANTRSQLKVTDERLDLIVTGSRVSGTQILLDVTNQTGPAQILGQATSDVVLQAGSASANYPYYFHADAGAKFTAIEADDATGAIYVGGSGYGSSVNIGTAGSRIIAVGNTSSATAVDIKAGNSGVIITGSLNVSGAITASVGGIKFPDGSTLTSSVGLGGGGGVSSAEVSGAITGALTPYATLTGVSGTFTTFAQVTGAISNFPTRTEVTGALTNYATLTGVSASFAKLVGDNSFNGNQTITGSLITSGTLISLQANTRSQLKVTNERLDLIVTGSRVSGTQILLDASNTSGISQIVNQAGTHVFMQAGSASANYPYYFHADAANKFTAIEADDNSSTIYVGGTGYASAINIGTAGSRNILIGNTSGSTTLNIKAGTAGTIVTGSLTVSGSTTITGSLTISSAIIGSNLTGSNTGDITLGTPNGLSLAGQQLSLAAASTASAGAITTGAQEFAGNKTFGTILSNNIVVYGSAGEGSLTLNPNGEVVIKGEGGGGGTYLWDNNGSNYLSSSFAYTDSRAQFRDQNGVNWLNVSNFDNTITVNTASAAPSAILDIVSTNKGVLFPRVSGSARASMTGTTGLIVYQTDTSGSDGEGLYIYKSTGWVQII